MQPLITPQWLEQAKEGGSAAGQETAATLPPPQPGAITTNTSSGVLNSAEEITSNPALGPEPAAALTPIIGSAKAESATGAPEPTLRASETHTFIVFLDGAPGVGGVAERATALLASLGEAAQPSILFDQLNGFAVQTTAPQAQRLRALGGVRSVDAEQVVSLERPINVVKTPSLPPQDDVTGAALTPYGDMQFGSGEYLPWGVRAVWQGRDISTKGNIATNSYAFVIDSGVRSNTDDLNINTTSSWHKSWTGESPFSDGQGHGTHVAGTIAALANGRGVVGVAPGANLVSLKVFNNNGGGATSTTIIAAINHAASVINTNSLDKNKVVVNMSLGGSLNTSIESAVKNAANQGILFSVAAGNSGKDADGFSPASAGDHAKVYTVSAVDSTYKMPEFSNWDNMSGGDDVDFAAPGVRVLSHYTEGYLAWMDGTSMAAPSAAGLLLMGGITPGDLVAPFSNRVADPMVWGSNFPT